MKGSRKLNELLEDNQKRPEKLFKYAHKKTSAFTPEDREKVRNKFDVYVIFDEKKPVFVGRAEGYSPARQPMNNNLYTKLGQCNSRSETGTTKFRKTYAQNKGLNPNHLKDTTADKYSFTFRYIKVEDELAFINILGILALECTRDKEYGLYSSQ